MMKFRVTLIAALAALLPATEALANDAWDQSRGRDRDRSEQSQDRGSSDRGQDRRRESSDRGREAAREAPRPDLGGIVRSVSAGRPGRMLGVSPRGDGYVVRWEYPGGRVGDIMVDGRTGRVTGER